MSAPVRRGRGNKSGSVAADVDDEMDARYVEEEAHLRQALAKLQEAQEELKLSELDFLLCEADDRSLGVLLSKSTESNGQGPRAAGRALGVRGEAEEASSVVEALRAERLLRARRHLSAEQVRRKMASVVAKARLQAATAQLNEADIETVAAAQAEKEAADASANAWAQVHLTRVRKSKVRQRAEAVAQAVRQRAEEEERLLQAHAKMEQAHAHLKHLELELVLCEADERALDGVLSESTEPRRTSWSPTSGGDRGLMAPPVWRGLISAVVDVDDEMSLDTDDIGAGVGVGGNGPDQAKEVPSGATEARQLERLTRARGQLGVERARREAALAQTVKQREVASAAARTQLEAAAAQLIKAKAEVTTAAHEEKEAVDAAAKAWSQVHTTLVRTGTAAQRAEAEARAAGERAQEEARLQQAKATLEGAEKRLRQTERELALCEAEARSLREAEETAAGSHLEMEARSRLEAKEMKRRERLRRARGQLGAQQVRHIASPDIASAEAKVRHEAASTASMARLEAAVAQLVEAEAKVTSAAQAQRKAAEALFEPWVHLEEEEEGGAAAQGAEAKARVAQALAEEEAQAKLDTAQERLQQTARELAVCEADARAFQLIPSPAFMSPPFPPQRPEASRPGWSPLALRTPSEIISGLSPVQRRGSPMNTRSLSTQSTGSPSSSCLPPRPPHTATPSRRSTVSLMGSMGSRRRVAVVPSFVSCQHEPTDRQGSGSSGPRPVAAQPPITPASALAAQRWLSDTMQEFEDKEADDLNRTVLARI